MKRTNLVLDEKLLDDVRSLLGERTYSQAVNRALAETVRLAKLRKISKYFGKDIWKGNLSEMREDSPK